MNALWLCRFIPWSGLPGFSVKEATASYSENRIFAMSHSAPNKRPRPFIRKIGFHSEPDSQMIITMYFSLLSNFVLINVTRGSVTASTGSLPNKTLKKQVKRLPQPSFDFIFKQLDQWSCCATNIQFKNKCLVFDGWNYSRHVEQFISAYQFERQIRSPPASYSEKKSEKGGLFYGKTRYAATHTSVLRRFGA